MLIRLVVCWASAIAIWSSSPLLAEPYADQFDIDIEAGPLQLSLARLSEQTNTTILARFDQIEAMSAQSIAGQYAVEEALGLLVEGLKLEVQAVGDAFIIVQATPNLPESAVAQHPTIISPEAPESRPNSISELRNEVILVTGFRSSNTASIRSKFSADDIIDGINQDTITLLPDLTVSDVARRVPGLSAIPENGTSTTRKIEGSQNVLIRGLDSNFTQTTIDGLPFTSASELDRAANLSLMPPTAISRIEAIKTLSADKDPHGLSGQLNLQTASALALGRNTTSLRASVGKNSTAGEGIEDQSANLRFDFLDRRVFGSSGQFGLSAAASYERFYSTSLDARPGGESSTYLFFSPDPLDSESVDRFSESNGFPSARRNQLYLFENQQERRSGLLKFEYAPSVDEQISVLAAVFQQSEEETRHEHLVVAIPDQRPIDQTLDSGGWRTAQVESGFVYQPEKNTTTVLQAHYERQIAADQLLRVAGTLSRTNVDVLRNMTKFDVEIGPNLTTGAPSFTYQFADSGDVALRFDDPDRADDPSQFTSSYIRERQQDIEQDLLFARADYSINTGRDALGWGAQSGLALTHRNQRFDRNYIEGDLFDLNNCASSDVRQCPLADFSSFVEEIQFPTTDADVGFLFVNDELAREVWEDQGRPITIDRSDNSISSDYAFEETIFGSYAKLTYRAPNLRIESGLRYDATEVTADIFLRDRRLPSDPDSAQYLPARRAYDYSFVLPSVLIRYDLSDHWVLRGGYSRTIGRPNIRDLTRGETISVPDGGRVDISRGNPELRPLVSDNLDASIEYFFDDGRGLVSAAAFHKHVDDLIFLRATEISDFELDGERLDATISQPVNASSSSVYGVELAIRKDFADDVPAPWDGFVVDANLTWTASDFTYFDRDGFARNPGGWVNQPELIYNFSLAYEQGPFAAKAAYNFVDEYLSNILSNTGDLHDTYASPRGVWDLQFRYALTDHVLLLAEVQNLTAEGLRFERRFPFGDRLATQAERGRVVWTGLRVSF